MTRNGVTETVVVDARRHSRMKWLWTGWLIAFLAALALTIHSYMVYFIPNAQFMDLIWLPACLAAIALSIPIGLSSPRIYHDRPRDRLFWTAARILTPPVLALVLWRGLMVGTPAFAHHFASTAEAAHTYSVEASANTYLRYTGKLGRCIGKVYLGSDIPLLGLYVCNVPKAHWHRVQVGDQIKLYGAASKFGLKYTELQPLW